MFAASVQVSKTQQEVDRESLSPRSAQPQSMPEVLTPVRDEIYCDYWHLKGWICQKPSEPTR